MHRPITWLHDQLHAPCSAHGLQKAEAIECDPWILLQVEALKFAFWPPLDAMGNCHRALVRNIIVTQVKSAQRRLTSALGELCRQHHSALIAKVHPLQSQVAQGATLERFASALVAGRRTTLWRRRRLSWHAPFRRAFDVRIEEFMQHHARSVCATECTIHTRAHTTTHIHSIASSRSGCS